MYVIFDSLYEPIIEISNLTFYSKYNRLGKITNLNTYKIKENISKGIWNQDIYK